MLLKDVLTRTVQLQDIFARRLEDVFIKTNVCWDSTLILIGDFNLSSENRHLDAVIQAHKLSNLILTNQHAFGLKIPHALTLTGKIYRSYPILLRLVFQTTIN